MKLQVFVGWDPREDIAWEVCRHSILSRTDPRHVEVRPLVQSELRERGLYTRAVDALAATEFSLTRFLTPHLAGQEGYAIFLDCDFLFLADIRQVLRDVDPRNAISVVQHNYQPEPGVKMDGAIQHPYPRKNWSSFIVFNCAHPSVQALTPAVVNQSAPSFLHRFSWLNDNEIGELDKGWNYLEGWYKPHYDNLKAIHFTLGGPWFESKKTCDFAGLWNQEYINFNSISNSKKAA